MTAVFLCSFLVKLIKVSGERKRRGTGAKDQLIRKNVNILPEHSAHCHLFPNIILSSRVSMWFVFLTADPCLPLTPPLTPPHPPQSTDRPVSSAP